jgi:alpha-1,3-rhamnosyl/mannosyltransferase
LRIVVNHLIATGTKTGVGHYTAQLLRCLRAQAGDDLIDGTPKDWVHRLTRLGQRLRPLLDNTKAPRRTPAGEAAAEPGSPGRPGASWRTHVLNALRECGRSVLVRHFRSLCARNHYDLYHEPNFIPLPLDLPTVVTVHDLSVLHHPEWHPADRVAMFERRFHKGLARCAHVLAISEFGRKEILDTFHLAPVRVTRTYMGVRPELGPLPPEVVQPTLKRLGLPPRYLLCLGTIEPRKNVLTLLRAYCSLPGPVRADYPLVLVGGWGWNAADVAGYLEGEARHRGVLHRGYLPDEHLSAVYNGARALAFPSFYEGFGLPPLEMMACGGAVLASTAGAVVETVGSRAHLVDPRDGDGWREALLRVLLDDDWWRSLRQGVTEVARPYTWEQCAADTLRVYRSHGASAAPPREAA